jgi:hypothetical protein
MNNLKKYAGLLNDAAPENHLLAYITPQERDMLVDAGGVKTPTPSGIFAYPPLGQPGTSPGTTTSGGSAFSGGSGSGGGGAQFTSGGNISPGTDVTGNVRNDNPFTGGNSNDDIDSTYTDTSFDVTPEPVEKNFFEKVIDFVASGGVVGNVIKAIGGKLNPENKYQGITGEDGYGEGDYISTQGDWAASKGFVDKAEDYYELDLEEQRDIDQKMYDDGVRSQAFSDLYNDGDTSNLNNLTTAERNEINKIIPDMAYQIGGTTSQPSMVNQYFANMNMAQGSPLSSQLQTDYNNAKNSVNSILGMIPTNQQFGYSTDPYSGLMASNLTTNPYNIDYLRRLGLI